MRPIIWYYRTTPAPMFHGTDGTSSSYSQHASSPKAAVGPRRRISDNSSSGDLSLSERRDRARISLRLEQGRRLGAESGAADGRGGRTPSVWRNETGRPHLTVGCVPSSGVSDPPLPRCCRSAPVVAPARPLFGIQSLSSPAPVSARLLVLFFLLLLLLGPSVKRPSPSSATTSPSSAFTAHFGDSDARLGRPHPDGRPS
mmetsp:Transcript_25469/g.47442  ORF Transcript_25469/g.47442 Transcript_25469/m.47442 type:complete len:200 (-) Transcript_25469:1393-1992(-)